MLLSSLLFFLKVYVFSGLQFPGFYKYRGKMTNILPGGGEYSPYIPPVGKALVSANVRLCNTKDFTCTKKLKNLLRKQAFVFVSQIFKGKVLQQI